jgi:2-methylcitrate dehydratase PrpD
MRSTQYLARYVEKTTYCDLPENVVTHVKRCILDWIGVSLVGCDNPASRIVIQLIREIGGKEESTVIGDPLKNSCINAALANGVTGHASELDDIHEESLIHPAAPVMPAAFAVAERIDANGKDLITAVALGYEVEIRLGKALMPSHYDFWHPTGTCGTFGAATAAGKLLDLNEDCLTHVFGIAGTEASGLIGSFGTMCKPFNAGLAARDGVTAAILADMGFTSSTSILDNLNGYLYATSHQPNLDKLVVDLGIEYEITNTVFKRHACCGHTHGAIDAVIDLRMENKIKPRDIIEIKVGTYPIAVNIVGKNYNPRTSAEAKFSLPFCIASAAIHGSVGLDAFSNDQIVNQSLRKLMRLVKIYVDDEYNDARLGCAKVMIQTKSEGEFTKQVDVPKGYPEHPLTDSELENKFRHLSLSSLSEKKVSMLEKVINKLEKVGNVSNITDLLAPRKLN